MASDKERILLVEGNSADADLMSNLLTSEGYQVRTAASGSAGLAAFNEFQPDLVVVGANLPEGPNGFEVCRQLRSQSDVPLIMTSERQEEIDVVVALELGADDYVGKPLRPREFVTRVRALLRRAARAQRAASEKEHLSYPGLEIDLPTRTVVVQGEEVHLTPKEFDLLYTLASHPRRVFSRQELIERVWRYTPKGDLRTVDTHIKRLRGKLQEGRNVPWALGTVWGVGYRFDIKD